jgi:hypothetical protein
MDRSKGRLMAVTEIKDISELLEQLNTKTLEDTHFKWTPDPIEPITTYSITNSGISDPYYGAVPNVAISGSTMSTTGINVSPVWTTANAGQNWTTTTNNTIGGYSLANTSSTVHINTDGLTMAEGSDIKIGTKSLKTWMEKVEERLNILTPNPELEKEWDQLRKLGERYRKLEKKCQEQSDMWKKLKSMPKPNINL